MHATVATKVAPTKTGQQRNCWNAPEQLVRGFFTVVTEHRCDRRGWSDSLLRRQQRRRLHGRAFSFAVWRAPLFGGMGGRLGPKPAAAGESAWNASSNLIVIVPSDEAQPR